MATNSSVIPNLTISGGQPRQFRESQRFTETSHTEESAYAGIGSSSQQYSSRIGVTLIFKKVMA
jgi:hypothetical protein